MLGFDVFTCYAVAGAGALAGLGLLATIQTEQPRIRQSVRLFQAALLCLASLICVALSSPQAHAIVLKVVIGFVGAGVSLLGWGFRNLNGRRTELSLGLGVVGGVAATLWLTGLFGSDTVYVRTFSSVLCVVSIAMAVDFSLLALTQGKAIGSDLALIGAASAFALNWLTILAWSFIEPGPYPAHWLHTPPWLTAITALWFALLPMTVAAMVLTNVNARMAQQLRARALSDDLTGALSRRGLRELGNRMLTLYASPASLLAVMMVDIDNFKEVNERIGHAAGDEVLRQVAQAVRDEVRLDALVARHGGEELSVLVPVRSHLEAQAMAEQVRARIERSAFTTSRGKVSVTVSVGVNFHNPDSTLEDDLARAEANLFEAKHHGRNRVVTGHRETATAELV
jgi:diguanylate cyclase (GGDEF)-like protein